MLDEQPSSAQPYIPSLGQGPRRALFIQCALAHSGAWNGVFDALAGRLAAVALDLRGHGHSPDWDEVEDYHACTTRLAAEIIETELAAVADFVAIRWARASAGPRRARDLRRRHGHRVARGVCA